MMLRPAGSDADVLVHMIDEYAEFLAKLPWTPSAILEGGVFLPPHGLQPGMLPGILECTC